MTETTHPRRTRWAFRTLVFGAAIFSIWRTWRFEGYTDFQVYYDYAVRVRELWFGSGSANFAVDPENTSPFRYLPIWGVLFLPLSFLPLHAARAVFVAWQWILYATVLRQVRDRHKLDWRAEAFLLLGTFRFAWDNATIGQVSCLLLYLLWRAMPRQWSSRGRARFLALAASLKLQPLGLLTIPFFRRQWSFLFKFITVFGVLLLASFVVGADAVDSWIQLSFSSVSVLDPATIGNQSLYGAFVRVIPAHAREIFLGVLGLTGLWMGGIWWKLGRPSQLGWTMGIAFLPIFGVLTWKNTYVLGLIPLAFFFSEKIPRIAWACVAFQLLSRGVLGDRLNAISLHYGVLPWIAWAAWVYGFQRFYFDFRIATKASTRSRK